MAKHAPIANTVGGVLSPLLANIALEVLDEHFTQVRASISPTRVDRSRRRRHGLPVYRLVRYGDDFVVLVILVATVMGGPVSPRSRRNSPMNCSLRPSP